MFFSQASAYGLRAVTELARAWPNEWLLASDIATRLDIPLHYLAKVLQSLVKKGILDSQRGRQGGFKLAIAPDQLTAWDVVSELDDVRKIEACVMGEEFCCDDSPCPLHLLWKGIRTHFIESLETTTFSNLAEFQRNGNVQNLLPKRPPDS